MFQGLLEFLGVLGGYCKAYFSILLTLILESLVYAMLIAIPVDYMVKEVFSKSVSFLFVFCALFLINTIHFMLKFKEGFNESAFLPDDEE